MGRERKLPQSFYGIAVVTGLLGNSLPQIWFGRLWKRNGLATSLWVSYASSPMDVFNYAYALVQVGLLLETNISDIVSVVHDQGKG